MSRSTKRNAHRLGVLIALIAMTSLFIYGCSDDPVTPTTADTSGGAAHGRLLDFPQPNRMSPDPGNVALEKALKNACDDLGTATWMPFPELLTDMAEAACGGVEDCEDAPPGSKYWDAECAAGKIDDVWETYEAAHIASNTSLQQNAMNINDWEDTQKLKCYSLEGPAKTKCEDAASTIAGQQMQAAVDKWCQEGADANQAAMDSLADCCKTCKKVDVEVEQRDMQPINH